MYDDSNWGRLRNEIRVKFLNSLKAVYEARPCWAETTSVDCVPLRFFADVYLLRLRDAAWAAPSSFAA